jgi:hypothetical protein
MNAIDVVRCKDAALRDFRLTAGNVMIRLSGEAPRKRRIGRIFPGNSVGAEDKSRVLILLQGKDR